MAKARTALTIGPLDPTGRDGVLADLKAFSALGLHGAAAITAIGDRTLDGGTVVAQLETLLGKTGFDAVKLECPAGADILEAIAGAIVSFEVLNLVVDPAGAALDTAAAEVLKRRLLPRAAFVVPNAAEAAALARTAVETWEDMRRAAEAIAALGPANVVIKGGKLPGEHVTDLFFDGKDFRDLTADRTELPDVRGTGSTFAAAVVAGLAKGETAEYCVASAKAYVTKALQSAYEFGDSPALHHFYRYWRPSGPGSRP